MPTAFLLADALYDSVHLKFIVTGTGRCGTVYMARLLTQLGIPCGHESLFDFRGYDGLCERLSGRRPVTLSDISKKEPWTDPEEIVADSSYGAAPFLNREPCKSIPVLHVVRHPLMVVGSFVRDFKYFTLAKPNDHHWQDFIYSHLPELSTIGTSFERACYFYIKWNKMISDAKQNRRYMRHKIEDGLTPRIISFLGLDGISRIPEVPPDTNSRRGNNKPLQLKYIRKGPIRDQFVFLANELGYELQ